MLLLHGWPYDVHAFDAVAPQLAAKGYRVIVPYLRGYGPTRFLSAETPRSGQQAALGRDLLELMDALGLPNAALVGYDWGGRAACVVAAIRRGRLGALAGGVAAAVLIAAPWYLFNWIRMGNPVYPLLPRLFGGPAGVAERIINWSGSASKSCATSRVPTQAPSSSMRSKPPRR